MISAASRDHGPVPTQPRTPHTPASTVAECSSTPSRHAPPGLVWVAIGSVGLVGFIALTVLVVTTRGRDAFDQAVFATAPALRTDALTRIAHIVTDLGVFPVVAGAAVLVALALRRQSRRWFASTILVGSVAITASVVFLMKIAVGRARPGTDSLVGTPALDYAFPSGHTTDGSVVWMLSAVLVALALRRPSTRVAVLAGGGLIGVAVGLSRVYLGYHWATDVLAGWCLATAVVCAAGLVRTMFDQVLEEMALPLTAGVVPVRTSPSCSLRSWCRRSRRRPGWVWSSRESRPSSSPARPRTAPAAAVGGDRRGGRRCAGG